MMKNKMKFELTFLCFLAVLLLFTACEDDRELPTSPPLESYTETINLLTDQTATGQDMRASFNLLADVEDGFITIACFIRPDEAINMFEDIEDEIAELSEDIENIEIEIINMELQDTLTAEDSLMIDSLRQAQADKQVEVGEFEVQLDSLDSWLDDRFKLSIWMDGDTVEYYPRAIFIDSTTLGANDEPMSYLEGNTLVWGQGFYTAPFDSVSGWRGMTMRLDIEEFWVADEGWDIGGPYIHTTKPTRATRYDDQYPIRDYVDRMTPGTTHTLHFRFGAADLTAKVTASLYVVYNTAVRR